MPTDYGPPLGQLLLLGQPAVGDVDDWPDYVHDFRLTPEHIPDLIRLATDEALRRQDEEEAAGWAPVHAWRALGQLRAEAAISPLLGVLEGDYDEWASEELPQVYALMGPAALPVLQAYLADPGHPERAREDALTGLQVIAEQHPALRDSAVGDIRRQLELFADNDPTMNGFLIAALTDLYVDDALPLIEQAFDADVVDPTFIDQNFVRRKFGLAPLDTEPPRFVPVLVAPTPAGLVTAAVPRPKAPQAPGGPSRVKSKRKMAQESRRKNKKRK